MGFRSRSMVIDPNVEAAWVVGFWVFGMGRNASPDPTLWIPWDPPGTSLPPYDRTPAAAMYRPVYIIIYRRILYPRPPSPGKSGNK